MNLRCRVRLVACLAVGVVVVGGCTTPVDKAGGQVVRLPLVLHGIDTRAAVEIEPFVDEVAKSSGGSIQFEFAADWHRTDAAADAEAIAALRAGSVDFAVVPVRAWHAAGVSSFDALIAPMAIDSYALQDQVLQDPMVGDMLTGVRKLGLTGIGVLPGPLREPTGITRDLLLPDDFRGARVAFSDGVVADRSLRQLGATPVPSAFNGADVSGFDGLEQQVSSIEGNKYDGIVRSVTANVALWPRPYVVVGSAAAVGALSTQQLGVLTAAARKAVPATSAVHEKLDSDAVSTLCHRAKLAFLTADADQLQKWREAFRPVDDWLAEDQQTKRFLARIGRLRAGRPAEKSIPGCDPAGPTSVAGASTPIDGLYEITITTADLVAFGVPANQAAVGDYAITRREFNRGHFIETTRASTSQVWINGGSGRYSVNGDRLSLTFEEGSSGTEPDRRRAGESEEWIWSLYHGQLTLRWADSSAAVTDYPSGAAVKPWTRIGGSAVATSAAPVALAGRWKVSYTRAEFAAAGADPGELDVPANWGTFGLEFANGRFATADGEVWSNAGDYAVEGDLMTLNLRSTGEEFRFRWSVYKNTLSFAKVAGFASPTGFTVKPWTRA